MKRFRNWVIVSLAALFIIALSIISIFDAHNVSAADTTLTNDSFQVIKQNALYKAIYANLVTCYNNMQPSITRSQDNAWAQFDSETYFLKDALNSNFLKFPYSVGGKNQSSCPAMITGWKTNGFINLFTGTGSYSGILGINADAVVPENSWYYGGDVDKMADFLKEINYKQKSDDSTYSRYKCFYVNLTPNENFYTNATSFLARPSIGNTFETQTFCAVVNDDGTIWRDKNGIMALTGNNDYFGNDDNGHATNTSNIIFVMFSGTDNALAPQFRHHDDHWDAQTYLQSNISELMLRYPYHNDLTGSDREIYSATVYVQNVSDKSNIDGDYCSKHGYVWCGWWDNYGVAGLSWGTHYVASLMNLGGNITYNEFRDRMANLMLKAYDMNGAQLFGKAEAVEYSPSQISYEKQASSAKFLKYFLGNTTSGSSNYRSGKFTEAEKYVLYYTYLTERYNTLVTPDASSDRVKVYWPEKDEAGNFTGNFTEQYIYNPDSANASVEQYILNSDSKWDSSGASMGNWLKIAELFGGINAISAFADANLTGSILDPELPTPPTESEDESSTPTCFSDGSSLGWILCPVLELMSNAVNGMYDTVANQWLEIGANEMKASDSNGVYVGWKTFRDIANVIFVIMLIIVIFSQVTGFGLSNYGVKKTLPTLIMVAVLVNLSFILCQLAVDVTNILGDGLRSMFESLKVGTGTGVGLSDIVTGIGAGILQLAVVGGSAGLIIHFSGVGLGGALSMLLIPLLLALISALIGTIIFFLSLAIRKAGIFAMIVLCPVAIVCYALPNTKSFFQKWMKFFTALLMVYPICGILMGGGKFFSSILLTPDKDGQVGFFMALTAMLVQVVPFFFIPTLVSRSLNAIGGLGAKLAGLRTRFTRGAQGALSRSRWAQERQQRLTRNANIRRDSRLSNKWQKRLQNLDTKRDVNGELSKKNQQRYRRAEYELGRARARSDRAMIEDMQNSVTAGRDALAPGTARYDNVMDKLRNAANDEEVEELRNSLLNKHMSYSDGTNEYSVDANTIGEIKADGTLNNSIEGASNSMSAALLHYMHQYDANPSDKAALARIRALTKHMLDTGGDKGQTAVANALRGYTSATGGNSTRTQAFNSLTDYISRNGKWMAQFKPTDRGAFNLIGDGASSTATLRPSSDYNIAGGYAADMVPGLSDGAFDALDLEIANAGISGSMSQDVKESILQLNATLEAAYGDPRIAGRIKPNVTARANPIHEEAYKIERQIWLSSSDNIKKLRGKDSTGSAVEAVGTRMINGEKYLVGANNQILKSLYGNGNAKANEAYRRQIKDYQPLKANKGPADMNIPH